MDEQHEHRRGHDRAHPATDRVVVDGRHVWVERDAEGDIVGMSESQQAPEDTDDDYAVRPRPQPREQ